MTGNSSVAPSLHSALRIQKELRLPWSRLVIFTYGQPRIGNPSFASYTNSLPVAMTRVTNEDDVIPFIPPSSSMYRHHLTEMHVHNGTPTICDTGVDPACSTAQLSLLTIDSHKSVFGIHLGKKGC